jgi:hypothetical protein
MVVQEEEIKRMRCPCTSNTADVGIMGGFESAVKYKKYEGVRRNRRVRGFFFRV